VEGNAPGLLGEAVELRQDLGAEARLDVGTDRRLVRELSQQRAPVEQVPVQDFFAERRGPYDVRQLAMNSSMFADQDEPMGQKRSDALFDRQDGCSQHRQSVARS